MFPVEVTATHVYFDGTEFSFAFVRVITQRKGVEETLRENSLILGSTFEAITDLVTVHDRNLRVVLSNWHGRNHVTEEERQGTPYCYACYMRRDKPCDACPTLEVFRTGRTVLMEVANPHTGKICEVNAYPVLDNSGSVALVTEHVRDISERKQAEKALQESKEKYRSLVTNIPDVVWTIDDRFRFTFISPVIERLSGFTADEICRQGADIYFKCIHPDDRSGVTQALGRLFTEGQPYDVECRVRRKTGEWRWVHDRAAATYEKDGTRYADGLLSDITEHKAAERALRESQERFRELAELLPEIVFETDERGIVTFANRHTFEATGYSAEDYPHGFEAANIVAPWDQERAWQHIRLTAAGTTLGQIEYTAQRKDGTLFPVLTQSVPIIRQGKPIGIRGIVMDITERKNTEDDLFRSRQMLQSVLDHIPQGVFWKDRRGVYLGGNRAFLTHVGLDSLDQLCGKTVSTIPGGDLAGSYRADDELVMKNDAPKLAYEELVPLPGDSTSWLRISKVPLHDPDGAATGLLGIYEDITERKRAEKALRASEERLRAMFQCAAEGILVSNFETLELVYANPALCRMMGYTDKELTGMRVSDLHRPEDWKSISVWFATQTRGEATSAQAVRCLCKDGSTIYVDINSSRVEIDGKACCVAFFADVTARKQAEETVREYERVAEGMRDMLAVVDREYKYRVVNGAYLWSYGVERDQVVGHSCWEVTGREVFEAAIKGNLDSCFCGGTVEYEMKRYFPRLGERHLSVRYFPVARPEGIDGVACLVSDFTDRKRAQEELQRSRDQLRALAAQLQNIREEERREVAREIHDQPGQALTAIKLDLCALVREMGGDLQHPPGRVASILKLVDETIQCVRQISTELRPGILDDLGLVAAIEWAGEDFEARTGTKCRLDLPHEKIATDPERATAIFRIFQETLTNVTRHAVASEVKVRLVEENGHLILDVKDNGKGIPEDKLSGSESLGILGMRERAELLGGKLMITGVSGWGTTVRVSIPETHEAARGRLGHD